MSEAAHALLSASGASRWLECTPSARLEETLPEKTSGYAEEGRLAHEIAELKLRRVLLAPSVFSKAQFNAALKKLKSRELFQEEMLRHADTYVDYISYIVHGYQNTPPYVTAEKKLRYDAWVPEGFGTGDCIIIGGKNLYVIDFKYGKGVPVDAAENPQMKLYALGALSAYSMLYDIETVYMAIIQPRVFDAPLEWNISKADLLAWAESIRPIATAAFEGKGEYKTGDWCQFCRARSLCRARAEFYTDLESYKQARPPLISDAEVGEILHRARALASWVKNLEDYGLEQCLTGDGIPGWKAVEGRGNRVFKDQDTAFATLIESGTEEELLYNRTPLSLAKIEEMLGKAKFKKLLADQIDKAPGKPTLVPESDNREPITRRSAAEDFAEPPTA